MKIQEMEIEKIIPYENNPRINDAAVEKVAASIREFGWQQPIVVDRDMVVVAGHTRLKAAQLLQLKTAPVVVADMLTDEQVKAYRLADNKTAEFSEWDPGALDLEIFDISEIDMSAFGFEQAEHTAWFDRTEKDGAQRQDGNDEYNEFLEKFEPKKTTDDCYTPDNIYEAVANWTVKEYGADRKNFVRPFYPGGDYQRYKYEEDSIVVDNPPFSILAEILRYYTENKIKFFLFAPALTLFSTSASACCAICTGSDVTYENGATIGTSFLTNLESSCRLRSAPDLYAAIDTANKENLRAMHRDLPKYVYPDYVITSAQMTPFSRYGIDFRVPAAHCMHIRRLDAQKDADKAIFGSAFLLSDAMKAEREKAEREKAEREKAEREKAEVWTLSEREMEIIKSLGR